MKKVLALIAMMTLFGLHQAQDSGKHLFILSGQPISKWYKKWKSAKAETDSNAGKTYDVRMKSVKAQIQDQKIKAAVFAWMQGETVPKARGSA